MTQGMMRTDEAGMKKSHEAYARLIAAKKALCIASTKAAVMEAAKEFLMAKDDYERLPAREEILGGRSRRRKTRGGGGLQQLFTRRKISPPRPHTSYVGYANGPPRALEGRHKPIPKEWMEKHRKSMANPKKGGRRSTRRGARASRKRPTR